MIRAGRIQDLDIHVETIGITVTFEDGAIETYQGEGAISEAVERLFHQTRELIDSLED